MMPQECPKCEDELAHYGKLPSLCSECGADRTGKMYPGYVDDEGDTTRSKWSDQQRLIEEQRWFH
ncbi:hypothetical protein LCGC14_0369800 [marine sediment metagenome]|uniref:Uncharacterized protein n=1 Tax=marine sediment metagenome TaxID=412755 RepID=A0A0F9VSN4_9ZZZZ